jgi:hypothetical protein
MNSRALQFSALGVAAFVVARIEQGNIGAQYSKPINVEVPDIASDKSVKWDDDIVYVRRRVGLRLESRESR